VDECVPVPVCDKSIVRLAVKETCWVIVGDAERVGDGDLSVIVICCVGEPEADCSKVIVVEGEWLNVCVPSAELVRVTDGEARVSVTCGVGLRENENVSDQVELF
jgi:hypothetical protein